MRDTIEIVKDHWLIIIGGFVFIRLVELIIKRVVKRLFGVVLFTSKAVVKPLTPLKRLSIFDWVLLALVGGLASYIFILM